MVADTMSCTTVFNVTDTWEQVRRNENFEEIVGRELFLRFFTLEPEAMVIFGFDPEADLETLSKSHRFIKHSSYFIKMIDKTLSMLGPDMELLTEVLLELGQKHLCYGVKPEYYLSMGRAFIDEVETILGDSRFTPEVKDSWFEVYGAISYDLIRAQKM
ncbi:globin-like protein [Nitzschia inconspicua]|uniref:Globin-like protein n=1 Tax=Nitzschia inconspicua TaxID=303405 RepID=A0A9K3PZF3_9STRA|nr:globin-like protein [Nitzschia inconspicua]